MSISIRAGNQGQNPPSPDLAGPAPPPSPSGDGDWARAPWRAVDLARHRDLLRVPTMLSLQEQRFYLWLTRAWYTGSGAVVDLGAFVGGSTARLAEGHRLAGHRGAIFAFDRFRADERVKARLLYPHGIPPFAGSDALRLARRLLRPWRDRVILKPGEIQDQVWPGTPIELLLIDVFKRADLMDGMVRQFFPALVPGRAVVVHQDYLHWSQPWICALMARFGDAFEPLCHVPGDTVAFRLRKPLSRAAINDACLDGADDAALRQGIRTSRRMLGHWPVAARFDTLERALAHNPGQRVAWRMRAPDRPLNVAREVRPFPPRLGATGSRPWRGQAAASARG